MNISLYNIQQDYLQIVDQVINSEGELTSELETSLMINREQLEVKGTCYGFIVMDLESEIDAIDAQIKRLTGLKSVRTKTIEKLKTNLSTAMQVFEVTELKTPLIKINFRNSESVEITNEDQLAKKFITTKTVITPDKKAIKEAIKAGEFVEGATISYNKNLQIK